MKGEITISRYSTGRIGISVHDVNGCLITKAELSVENLGLVITGLAHVDCDYQIFPANAGKVRQTKEEMIWDAGPKSDEEKRRLFEPYEIDGWKARYDDYGNYHRRKHDRYRVTFTRYVDPQ